MKRAASRGVVIDKGAPDFDAALFGTSFNAQDPGRRPDRIVQANDVEALSVQAQLVSTWRSMGQMHRRQAASDCHSARAAERRSLKVWRSTRWRSELKWL